MADAMRYANAIGARKVKVTAYRAAVKLEDGTILVEKKWIAERRAKTLAQTLAAIGVKSDIVEVDWSSGIVQARGDRRDARNRRAVIEVIP